MEDIDLTLFLGGTRSGQERAGRGPGHGKGPGPVWYLATARPLGDDPAMAERIRATAAAAPPTGTRWNAPGIRAGSWRPCWPHRPRMPPCPPSCWTA